AAALTFFIDGSLKLICLYLENYFEDTAKNYD
ncbi:MAG: hypothetical protein ACI9SC_003356, partial [Gammaproteobacteria bacterium]